MKESRVRYDIAFIGCGISCSATLLQIINMLIIKGNCPPTKIAIIEGSDEFWLVYLTVAALRSIHY